MLKLGCSDEAQAEELQSGLDSLFGIARMAAGPGIAQISAESREAGKWATEILASFAPKRNQQHVLIEVPRPAHFDLIMTNIATNLRTAAANATERNDFMQVAISMHNFHDTYGQLPPPPSRTGVRQASWRVYLLPFLEDSQLYESFDQSKDWDAPENRALENRMPRLFGRGGKLATMSRISIDGQSPASFREIQDGTSNTIMLLQNPAGVPWMEPKDLDIEEAVALVMSLKEGETLIATFYDASTRRIKSGLTAEQVRPFFTWKNAEIVDLSTIVEK